MNFSELIKKVNDMNLDDKGKILLKDTLKKLDGLNLDDKGKVELKKALVHAEILKSKMTGLDYAYYVATLVIGVVLGLIIAAFI